MMRWSFMALFVVMLLGTGCTTKHLRIGGMVCPPGHTQDMVYKDFSECRVYDEKEAERASRVKVPDDCIECLTERGYRVDE